MIGPHPSLLDLIFSKFIDFVTDILYKSPLGARNQACPSFKCALSRQINDHSDRVPNIWRADCQTMKAEAAKSSSVILESDDIQTAWDRFNSCFIELSLPYTTIWQKCN
ncbi:unnamed protein product [Dicrocoelium dendriticum]|nr:unnamed protein product [Dicrocoelium dendriticum]